MRTLGVDIKLSELTLTRRVSALPWLFEECFWACVYVCVYKQQRTFNFFVTVQLRTGNSFLAVISRRLRHMNGEYIGAIVCIASSHCIVAIGKWYKSDYCFVNLAADTIVEEQWKRIPCYGSFYSITCSKSIWPIPIADISPFPLFKI